VNKLIWVKWIDAFASIVHKTRDLEFDEFHDSLYQPGDTKHDDDDFEYRDRSLSVGITAITPEGVVPLHESTIPSKVFNFWVGHTNFDIGERRRFELISSTPGVECINAVSRYRFRVGIGLAFNQEQVKQEITDRLIYGGSQHIVDRLRLFMSRNYPYWSVYQMQDGKIEVSGGLTPEEVMDRGEAFEQGAQRLWRSW
jgi:hypothetical protein